MRRQTARMSATAVQNRRLVFLVREQDDKSRRLSSWGQGALSLFLRSYLATCLLKAHSQFVRSLASTHATPYHARAVTWPRS